MAQQSIAKFMKQTHTLEEDPMDPATAFDNISALWEPQDPPSANNNTIEISYAREWTNDDLLFFKLHYANIKKKDWTTFLCPLMDDDLPAAAQELVDLQMGLEHFLLGDHVDKSITVRVFGDIMVLIHSYDANESFTKKLSQLLLDTCNPAPRLFMISPQKKAIQVPRATYFWKSITDGSVIGRKKVDKIPSVTIISVEDKGEGNTEYQIPGKMLAVAWANYQETKQPQTIFALRVIGGTCTFYRADFSAEYLASICTTPSEDVTIFRVGGESSQSNRGISLVAPGLDRTLAIVILCSIYRYCEPVYEASAHNYRNYVPVYEASAHNYRNYVPIYEASAHNYGNCVPVYETSAHNSPAAMTMDRLQKLAKSRGVAN